MRLKYYPAYTGELGRTDWMKYVDDLRICGRMYIYKPQNQPEFTKVTKKELRKLVGLILIDLPACERYEAILEFDTDSRLSDYMSRYMIQGGQLSQSELLDFMADNTMNHFMEKLEEIFETVQEIEESNHDDYLKECSYDSYERFCTT